MRTRRIVEGEGPRIGGGEEYRLMWQSPRERSEGKIYALVFMMVSSLCFIQ